MNKCTPTLLATFVYVTFYSTSVHADLSQQCMAQVPTFTGTLITEDINTLPVKISSDTSTVNYPLSAIFKGNVIVTQGNRQLNADNIKIDQIKNDETKNQIRIVTANGNILYTDEQIQLHGTELHSNLENKDSDILNTFYQMVGRQGRGEADQIQLRNNRYILMKNGTFTSCLPNDNSWSIVGSEIIQDDKEQLAEIWNAKFKIGSVPIFYTPYLQIPTGNRRRSGLLIPSPQYSNNNGLELALPFYWNIAPNYDATVTPNIITRRGIQFMNEFRYLIAPGHGLIEIDWLPNDRKYKKDNTDRTRDDRWLAHWQHYGVYNQYWRTSVDFNKVSDYKYGEDLDSDYVSSTANYLRQNYSAGYAGQNWDSTLQLKKFQILTSGVDPYRAEPMLDFNVYQYNIGPINFHTYGQFAHFTNNNSLYPEAKRFHIEPSISIPLAKQWGSLNTEFKLMSTHYEQDISDAFIQQNGDYLKKSVTRTIPQYKINGQLVFERSTELFDEQYSNTIEPQVQYLYIPHRDQSSIHNYDSTILQTDYNGLFRDRQYSGLDRIAPANQLSTGLTTRLYDKQANEKFHFSLGQIYYFNSNVLNDSSILLDSNRNKGSLVWASDAYWKINEKLRLKAGVQYDDRLGAIALGDSVLEYKQDEQTFIQFSYRYASREYISAMVSSWYANKKVYQHDISQIGAVASWPVNDNWTIVGAYYYDPQEKQTVNSLIGLQYSTCCWGTTFALERKITDWNQDNNQKSNYDTKISFSIELRGLTPYNTPSANKILRSSILPYRPSF